MQRYIIIRLGHALLAMLVISVIVFALARLSGNPLDVLMPDDATPEDYEQVAANGGGHQGVVELPLSD